MKNDKRFSNYPLSSEKKWAAYFWSLLEKALELHAEKQTHFANPRQQQIAKDLLGRFSGIRSSFFGGYPEAERVKIHVCPQALPGGGEEKTIACLMVKGSFPEGILTHRDFLGALLGLGIKREMIGDIIYRGGEKAFVFLEKELVPFVKTNFRKAGLFTVETEEIGLDELEAGFEPQCVKQIKGTVASMRLDAVAGLGFGLSRSKIAPLIKGEQMKINYQLVSRPSQLVKEGDLISLTGRGRLEVVEKRGKSRKGRTHLLLHRII
ncbi:MAG: hypothetical protein GX996_06930 [Firmicutes bacterium]|nr:hypothetical protein [Bacillota bacterium]